MNTPASLTYGTPVHIGFGQATVLRSERRHGQDGYIVQRGLEVAGYASNDGHTLGAPIASSPYPEWISARSVRPLWVCEVCGGAMQAPTGTCGSQCVDAARATADIPADEARQQSA